MTCTVDVYPDGEQATFYQATVITARKIHACEECGSKIRPGQKYERVVAVWEGDFCVIKTCSPCLGIRKEHFPGGCTHGTMRIDFHEACGFDYAAVPKFEEGYEEEP